jgi:hypothetical protein
MTSHIPTVMENSMPPQSTKMNSDARITLIAAAALVLNGCAYQGAIRNDFYQPTARAAAPAKVALMTDAGESTAIRGGTSVGTAEIETNPAFLRAVENGLTALYGPIDTIKRGESSPTADFYVHIAPNFPKRVGLFFLDPTSRQVIAKHERPGPRFGEKDDSGWYDFLAFIPPLYFLFPVFSEIDGVRADTFVEHSLAASLDEIFAEVRADRTLADYAAGKRRARALEESGDAALSAHDAAAALDDYARALRTAPPGSAVEVRVRERYLRLAAASPSEEVPEEAKSLMAKGKAFAREAKSPDDFRDAAAAMNQALALAPSWASAYFNAALAEEGAGLWNDAARHLRDYLKLKPDAEDKAKVLEKIADLEVHEERRDKPAGEAVQP